MEILKLQKPITKIKNLPWRLNSRLEMTKKTLSVLEDRSIDIFLTQKQVGEKKVTKPQGFMVMYQKI